MKSSADPKSTQLSLTPARSSARSSLPTNGVENAVTSPDALAFLPSPQQARWKPLRSGLLNLYRYDDEEFWYEDGHLLLRGNNGTGKSRVLALQLPFLLDGEVAAHRLEPDGDPAKRIEWNLLMNKHEERVGYTWIEFARREVSDNGQVTDHFLTLGCGLRAVKGKKDVDKWFFITPQRIRQNLFLQGRGGQPLSREGLNSAVRGIGHTFKTASDYRRAIDQSLFKLGEHRYEALVSLLIQLRQPQLSRQLDDSRLSAALSEALPPLSPDLIHDVAEAFRGLEADRLALVGFSAARQATETFLNAYRRYVQVAARRRAMELRGAQASYEKTQTDIRSLERLLEQLDDEIQTRTRDQESLQLSLEGTEATRETLRSSPQMQDARRLNDARKAVEDKHQAMLSAQKRQEQLHTDTLQQSHRLRQEQDRLAQTLDRAETLRHKLDDLADDACLAPQHSPLSTLLTGLERLEEAPELLPLLDAAHRQGLQTRLDAQLQSRHKGLLQLEKQLKALQQALTELHVQERSHRQLTDRLDQTLEQQQQQALELEARQERYVLAYEQWVRGLQLLVPPEVDTVPELLRSWMDDPQQDNPLPQQVQQALATVLQRLAQARASQEQTQRALQTTLGALHAELRTLRAGHHTPPPAPHTREPQAREGREGAPLWRVCDFAPDLDDAARAGLEAALEASGLLDAWITPDGRVLSPDTHDTWFLPRAQAGHPTSTQTLTHPLTHTLTRWLRPSVDRSDPAAASLPDGLVSDVLAFIGAGVGQGDHWVSLEGRWQLGPLTGAYTRPAAQHIGHAAREAARRQRLIQLETQVQETEAQLEQCRAVLQHLDEQLRTSQAEARALPSDQSLREGLATVSELARSVDALRRQVIEQEAQLAACRDKLAQHRQSRDLLALDLQLIALSPGLGLDDWEKQLGLIRAATFDYLQGLAGLWPSLRELADSHRRQQDAREQLEQSQQREGEARQQLQQAQSSAHQAAASFRVLEEAVGAAVKEIETRLQAVEHQLVQLKQSLVEGQKLLGVALVRQGEHRTSLGAKKEQLVQETDRRNSRVDQLKHLAGLKLLPVVGLVLSPRPGQEGDEEPTSDEGGEPRRWSVTRTLEVARQLETLLAQVSAEDGDWKRLEGQIFQHFQSLQNALLSQDYHPAGEQDQGLFIVKVPFQGQPLTVAELGQALADEVSTRQALLDAREKEVIENHLIGEISSQLHDKLHRGGELVKKMNHELRSRPMSTGMMLQFDWKVEDEQGLSGMLEARRLLLRNTVTWSPAEREQLGRFLQAQIQAVRSEHQSGTWQEQLTLALDYRRWHRFVIERQQDGRWLPLNRRTHGTGSGGEKAIALTIPQFAAAAAHYSSADGLAPRLILLDEAFVGVDSDMRNKCMGLLQTFDLDFMMTSEREWACYPALPGVSIYQLATRQGIDAIGVTRWVWNGRERARVEQHLPSMREAPASVEDEVEV